MLKTNSAVMPESGTTSLGALGYPNDEDPSSGPGRLGP